MEKYLIQLILAAVWICSSSLLHAEVIPLVEKPNVKWGGFVDTYYAFDFNRPQGSERLYTTQPLRNNEFNVNLAFLEAMIKGSRYHGRLALQTGTSVQANYAGENNALGAFKGSPPAGLIQEAVVGYRVNDQFWIDAGIYLSHIGFESFISRDNWTYSRSLIADFSPYYQSGLKLTYQNTSKFSAQLHIINGWTNIYNVNSGRSLGTQFAYHPSEKLSMIYNNFVGPRPGDVSRFFNDLVLKVYVFEKLDLAFSLDVGTQGKSNQTGTSVWLGAAAFGRYHFTPQISLTARIEKYSDPDQVIVQTDSLHGFVVTGSSMNVDVELQEGLLWRSEIRALLSRDAIYSSNEGLIKSDKFLVSSLSLSF